MGIVYPVGSAVLKKISHHSSWKAASVEMPYSEIMWKQPAASETRESAWSGDGRACLQSRWQMHRGVSKSSALLRLSPAVLLKSLSSSVLCLIRTSLTSTVPSPDRHIRPHGVTKPSTLGLSFNKYQVRYPNPGQKFRSLFSPELPVLSHTCLWCHPVSPRHQSSSNFSPAACSPWLAISLMIIIDCAVSVTSD